MPQLQNPTLTLSFLSDDLEAGHSALQAVTGSSIIRDSVTFRSQLLNGLKPSSNQVTLRLARSCASIEDIIATEGDVKAVLTDASTTLFTGYLSTNHSWAVTEAGEQALDITIEDTGTRLLGKAFIASGRHLFNCSASSAVQAVCTAAGITVSPSCPTLTDTVTRTVDSSQSCREILEQLLYELGHVYFFDVFGQLCLFKVDCTTTEGIPVVDGRDLCVVGGKAITLGKKIRQYRSARVTYKGLGTASGYLIYRNTTGRGEGHPYCYMELGPGQWFDGTGTYSQQEWEAELADSFTESALMEACNADGEIELVGSNEIIAVSAVTPNFTTIGGSVDCTITEAGGPCIRIEAHNNGGLPCFITRMDAYADIVYVKNTNTVRTAGIAAADGTSDNLLSEELSYVHTRELAQAHANLLGQYHRHCNAQYTFCSRRGIDPGSIIRLVDDVFTGLEVAVLVTARSWADGSDVSQFTAVGISAFDLWAAVHCQTIERGKNDTTGPQGLPGSDGSSFTVTIESTNGSVFRLDGVSTTLSCRVWVNTTEVTDDLDASLFCWKRTSSEPASDPSWDTSSKAIGHKSVDITPQDCAGRTVFSCEIDLSTYQP